jgi:hypothetical protein
MIYEVMSRNKEDLPDVQDKVKKGAAGNQMALE